MAEDLASMCLDNAENLNKHIIIYNKLHESGLFNSYQLGKSILSLRGVEWYF